MRNQKKGFVIWIILIAVLFVSIFYVYEKQKNTRQNITNTENTKVNEDKGKVSLSEVKIPSGSCKSSSGKIMTYERAFEIAKASSCAQVGNFTGKFYCNDNSGGIIDISVEPINHPGCGFSCLISIDKESAEEGWMCTGLIPSSEKELNKIPSASSANPSEIPSLNVN